MSLELFQKVPAGAIKTVFDDQNQPLFKRSDLGKNLDIRNIRDDFKEFSSDYSRPRSKIEDVCVTYPLGKTKILVAWWLATCARKTKVPGSSPAASYVQR